MQRKHRDRLVYVRKLVWNQHVGEHGSPWNLMRSNIYVVKMAKKEYLRMNFFAFLSWKKICVERIHLNACDECETRGGYGRTGEAKEDQKSRAVQSVVETRVNVVACWQCTLAVCELLLILCHSLQLLPRTTEIWGEDGPIIPQWHRSQSNLCNLIRATLQPIEIN